jgi:hypothetical protein
MEAALALYLIGMEVANADKKIDEREFDMLLHCARNAVERSSSKYVKEVAGILAKYGNPNVRPNPLKAHYESDSRTHEQIFKSVAKNLKRLDESDRMRYLDTAWGLFSEVAKSSGKTGYSLDNASDEELSIGAGIWLFLSDGMLPKELHQWIDAHGF